MREICEDKEIAKEKLGDEGAKKLQTRLADLRAAPFVTDLVVGDPKEIDLQAHPNSYKVDLHPKHWLLFCANHPKPPVTGASIDWSRVSRIKIIAIDKQS